MPRLNALRNGLLDSNLLQHLITDFLHDLGTRVIRLVHAVPETHQPATTHCPVTHKSQHPAETHRGQEHMDAASHTMQQA